MKRTLVIRIPILASTPEPTRDQLESIRAGIVNVFFNLLCAFDLLSEEGVRVDVEREDSPCPSRGSTGSFLR